MFNDQSVNKIEKFTGNPNWNPPKSKCSSVITGYSNYLQQEIKKLAAVNKTKPNISRKERDALQNLSQDKSILVQKADKGGSIVVLNTFDYENKIHNMLSDAKSQIDGIIEHLFNYEYISKEQKKFLNNYTLKVT